MRLTGRREAGLLVAITLLAAVLRLWHLDQNLPLVYNIDENARFVPDAATFLTERLGFRELVNPPGMMGVLSLIYHGWFGVQGLSPAEGLAEHPTQAFLIGRLLAAGMGIAAVPLLYVAGRRLVGRTAAMTAAFLLAVSFLAVAYSRLALADGPTVLFIVLGLLAAQWILRDGRWRGYVLAGLAVGLAAGFKYNAGIVLLAPLAAGALRAWDGHRRRTADAAATDPPHATGSDDPDGTARPSATAGEPWRVVLRRTVGLGAVALATFVVANPYLVLDPGELWDAIAYQQRWSTSGRYVGEPMTDGLRFYAWSIGWGVGWATLVVGTVGAALLAWRRWRVAVLLLPMIVAYLIVMGGTDRFFARWVLPLVPVLALTAGFAVAEAARLAGRIAGRRGSQAGGTAAAGAKAGRPGIAAVVVAVVLALALGDQSLRHSFHHAATVGRDDTRTTLRDWMRTNIPAREGVVLESMSPAAWMPTMAGEHQWYSLTRWSIYHTIPAVRRADAAKHPQLRRNAGFSGWSRILFPELIDVFERYGYCWVVTGSYQAGRVARTPDLVPAAVRFYRQLPQRARLVAQIDPFAASTGVREFEDLGASAPDPRSASGRRVDGDRGPDARTGQAFDPRTIGAGPEGGDGYRGLGRATVGGTTPSGPPGSDGRRAWGPMEAPVRYQIDRQATTYEQEYERPGPMVSVYRLTGGRCAEPGIVPNAPVN
ncbi:MAG: ArnT family glycosyltransferase [Solirubrobacteraceae bacterium]